MTDTIDREGVKTTISPILKALQTPYNDAIVAKVRRFGFEYEMLPSGYNGDGDHGDEDDGYCCRACNGSLRQWRIDNGIEASGVMDDPVSSLIQRAFDAGLISETEQHTYHCNDCDACDHNRSHPLLTAQTDCSCGVEFVSRIIDLDNFDQAAEDIERWVRVMNDWKDAGGWMPDGVTSNGNHVHVSSRGDSGGEFSDVMRRRAFGHVNAMYAVFDWVNVADGGCKRIRGYNSKPGSRGGGGWLSDRGYGTFEHRLWNTPSVPERLWGHLGISLGLQRWAFALVTAQPDFTFWDSTDRYYGDSHMADAAFKVIADNVGEVIRGVREYIPDAEQFEVAHDLIGGLTR